LAEPTSQVRSPSGFVAANLVLRFVLEVGALAGLAYAGVRLADGTVAAVVLGVGLPLLAGVVWGLFVAPKATFDAPLLVRLLAEALVMVSAGVLLLVAGSIALGVVLLVLWLLNRIALAATGRTGPVGG
jgi:Protein of unknown function (DUF2568)